MERHANNTNVLETIKVPLQRTTKTGRTIFAYLRRSTSKVEQSTSLIQQEDGIFSIVKKLWFEKENIKYFAETYSGFENKKRKKWGEMISEIDKLKEPCIVLARDISRLSRNPTDSQWIMDRLYGDNKHKIKIDKIYTLDYENIKEWNKSTDKDEVHKVLSAWYYDSIDTRRKSIGGILLKLENGEFPYKAPKWLESVIQWNKRVLRQNEKMPFVRKAFEMKAEWITHKEISKYLKKYWEIKLSDRELTDRLFKNTVYIWEYTEKTTWLHYPQEDTKPFLFAEWNLPIKRELWEKVQRALWRKNSQYWEWQEGDIIAIKLRTESWKRMSKYLAKGKYTNYKNTIDKINITETEIIINFISYIQSYIDTLVIKFAEEGLEMVHKGIDEIHYRRWLEILKEKPNTSMESDIAKIQALPEIIDAWIARDFIERNYIIHIGKSNYKEEQKISKSEPLTWRALSEPLTWRALELYEIIKSDSIKASVGVIKEHFLSKNNDLWKVKKEQITQLEKDKNEIEQEKKNYRREALKMGYSKEEINETTNDMENSIKLIDEQINEFLQGTDMEQYLERLPEILLKTFELTSNAISKGKTHDNKDDLLKLIEITTFELTVSNKKELKVKLFEVLDKLISSDNCILEAPSGVEPDYKALQASA